MLARAVFPLCYHFGLSGQSPMACAEAKGARMHVLREADARTRTGDPFITSEVLYQLSYVGSPASIAPG